jgi:hypothetical protein
MSTRSPISIGSYLRSRQSRQLTGLLQHAEWLSHLTRQVRRHLPPEFADRFEVVESNANCLVLLTNSPVWAARLRYASTDLRQRLAAADALQVNRIKVRVSPARCLQSRRKRQARRRLSAENARLLRQTAQALTDRKLADALCRLAERGEPAAKQAACRGTRDAGTWEEKDAD